MSTGLMTDPSLPVPPMAPGAFSDPSMVPHAGGVLAMESMAQIMARERAQATITNNSPLVQGLAGYVKQCWSSAWNAKRTTNVEERLLKAMNQRRGVYDPNVLADIRKQGGSEIYMMLTSNKCRAAASWIRDVTLGAKDEKPWGIDPSPIPDLPPAIMQAVQQLAQQEVQSAMQQTGQQPSPQDMERIQGYVHDRVLANARKRAQEACDRMEDKMEDQMAEGRFQKAFSAFIEDLVTFPSAFMKGPVVRNKPAMHWAPAPGGQFDLQVSDTLTLEWDRVDPFMAYPAPQSTGIEDGFFIERHRMTRSQLNELRGVDGYNEAAIAAVLDEFGRGGLREWLYIDSAKAQAEGKSMAAMMGSPEATIDALQYWGSVQGKMLVEWGMDEASIPDPSKEYNCEVWLIGQWVVKSTLNPDPLGRKPYFKTSYEEVPGVFWGNSVCDLCEDVQDQCNVAARAIANNVAIACLTADTVVYRHGQDRSMAPVTIGELWEKKNQHNSGLRRIKLRALDEGTGQFFGNRIVDVHDNGVADVFEVTTERGYKIKATGNHRFFTDAMSWQKLDDFCEGEYIGVNGQETKFEAACLDCGTPITRHGVRCRSCASKAENSSWNQTQIAMARANTGANITTAHGRYECKRARQDFCAECGARKEESGVRLEVHHKDKSPWNNHPDNLVTLCAKCHVDAHTRMDSYGDPYLHRFLSFDRIVSIVPAGRERVFDLEMTAPHHNFIANGFVSHNSGPQAQVNVDRLPNGEDITQMYPWKIWQTTSDPYGSVAPPITFFAPPMISGELMQIYTFFSGIADEHTGIPRYMAGDATGSGALRTSSGMSMLMNNAGKAIKHVIANIDQNVIKPLVERLYFYNMKYGDDPELKGDVQVVACGANSLVVKENQQQRMNEFLQLALTNPMVNQIVGEEAIAAILRQTAKQLNMDTDELVPPAEVIRARVFQQQQAAAAQQQAQQKFQMAMATAPSHEIQVERGPGGEMLGMTVLDKQQHVLGAPGVPMGPGMSGGGQGQQALPGNGPGPGGGAPPANHFAPSS